MGRLRGVRLAAASFISWFIAGGALAAPPVASGAGVVTATTSPATAAAILRATNRPFTPLILPTGPGAEQASSLASIAGSMLPDEGSTLFYNVSRGGDLPVVNGGTFTLSFLSRGKPSYDRVGLVVEERSDQLNASDPCEALTAGNHRITTLNGQITSRPAEARLIATAKASDVHLFGTVVDPYLVNVTAAFNGDLLVAAQLKKKVSIRAIPIGSDGKCLRTSAGAYLARLSIPSSTPYVFPKPPPSPPSVGVQVVPVGWSPPINRNCSYIIIAGVNDPAWNEVLKARGISRDVGTHFDLCQEDFNSTYTHLPDSIRAKIAIKNALGAFTHAFNWTADKFKSAGKTLGSPLKPILGEDAATAFGEGLMGQLPGSPLTGHLSVTIARGCGYVKDKVAATAAEKEGAKEVPADQRAISDKAVQGACDAVQAAMAESAKVNDFLQIDVTKEPRGPLMWIKVIFMAQNGATAGMLSQPFTASVTVRSKGGDGPMVAGSAGIPAYLLYKRDFPIPAGPAGSSLIVPVAVEPAILESSSEFREGATAYAGMSLNAGGYYGNDITIHSIMQDIPPPPS